MLNDLFMELDPDDDESEGDEILEMMNKSKKPSNDSKMDFAAKDQADSPIKERKTAPIENFLITKNPNKTDDCNKQADESTAKDLIDCEFSNDSIDFQNIQEPADVKNLEFNGKKLKFFITDITDEFYKINGIFPTVSIKALSSYWHGALSLFLSFFTFL